MKNNGIYQISVKNEDFYAKGIFCDCPLSLFYFALFKGRKLWATQANLMIYEPRHEKTCLVRTTMVQISLHNSTVCLICAFVVPCQDSKIHILTKSTISRLASLSLTWSHTSEDRFPRDVALIMLFCCPGKSMLP